MRAFDLKMKFGPCVGLTRMERWERANKFGLDPPRRIFDLLSGRDSDDGSNASLLSVYAL